MRAVTAWQADDGTLFGSKADCAAHEGLAHVCPQCNGQGTHGYVRLTRRVADPFLGNFGTREEEYNGDALPCGPCNGKGYTARPLVAISKTTITGYK